MSRSEERQHEVVFEILCCVMVADGKASGDEKVRIVELMAEYGCSWPKEEFVRRSREFVDRVRGEGFPKILNQCCEKAEGLDDEHAAQIVARCIRLARTDDSYMQLERNVIQRIEAKLKELPAIRRALLGPVKSDHSSWKRGKAQRISIAVLVSGMVSFVLFVVYGLAKALELSRSEVFGVFA